MWPTDTTLYLLVLGLAIPLYEITRVARLGVQETTSMRFCGVALLWIGYHLSPWLTYLGSPWNDFLLVPGLLDLGLLFSTVCMAAFVFGHWCVMAGRRTSARVWTRGSISGYRISAAVLFWSVFVSVLLFLISVGGISEAWRSSTGRGAGQFAERDLFGRIVQMLTIMQVVTSILGACLASLFLLTQKPTTLRVLGGVAALLAFSLPSMHGFSRGTGFAFIVLALVAIYLKQMRGLPVAMIAIPIALFLGSVGFNQRGNFAPGIASFMEAVPQALEAMNQGEQHVVMKEKSDVETNILDAMSVWTRVAAVAHDARPDPLIEVMNLLMSLNPLPSEMVQLSSVGPDLAAVMGTGTSVGLTTPVLSQIYYGLGFGGAAVMAVLGAIYGWFDRLRVVRPSALVLLCILMCLASLTVGLHSTLRAATRPLLYAFILFQGCSWFAAYFLGSRRQRRTRQDERTRQGLRTGV